MAYDPQMRASDADRDRVASLLREHHGDGRLTIEEFQERLDAAYAAKTLGQLDELMADLPGIDLYKLPEAGVRHLPRTAGPFPPVVRESDHDRLSPAWRAAWASWASVSLLVFVIWLITAASNHSANGLWFLWVAGPWGAILLGRWIFGGPPRGPRHQVYRPPGAPPPELGPDRDHDGPGRGTGG